VEGSGSGPKLMDLGLCVGGQQETRRTRERTRERVTRGQNWVHEKAPIRHPNQSNNNIQSVGHNNKQTLNLSFISGWCASWLLTKGGWILGSTF
jgi:hypothetical protein